MIVCHHGAVYMKIKNVANSEQGSKDAQQPTVDAKIFTDEELTALIEPILEMDDTSKDGYIDYPEFMRAQQKSQQNQQQQQQQQHAQKNGH